jgi:dihydroorotate dehydrogenase electron transfer subunit
MNKPHRDTIVEEHGLVLTQVEYPGRQYVLRLQAGEIARRAAPGTFVHVRCSDALPMRRPLSIQRVSAADGWIELLYKVVGSGLADLARAQAGDRLRLLGPIGQGFKPDPSRPQALLLGGGVGIPPLIFLAEALVRDGQPARAFFGSELPFPYEVNATGGSLTLLDRLGVPSQLASHAEVPGSSKGFVTDLARAWLKGESAANRNRITIYACGPTPMLKAVQQLAREFSLPSQLCLEEFMACAVGGCAGCVVPVQLDGQRQMKRVCVDGPVFDGAAVYGDAA